MANVTSYFFYGIFVTLPSLLVAANAHYKLNRTLLALDLISLRTRRGTLATTNANQAVSRVAQEVWNLVRVELEDIEWIEAETDLVMSILDLDLSVLEPSCCETCAKRQRASCIELQWEDIEELGLELDLGIEDMIYDLLQDPFNTVPSEIKTRVLDLLQYLHLELITTSDLLFSGPSEWYPLVPVGIKAVEHSCEGGMDGFDDGSFAAVSRIPRSFCTKIRNVSTRGAAFKNIIKAFRLDARDPATKGKAPPKENTPEDGEEKLMSDGFADWYMWTQGNNCY